jgi:hypothetical protein
MEDVCCEVKCLVVQNNFKHALGTENIFDVQFLVYEQNIFH